MVAQSQLLLLLLLMADLISNNNNNNNGLVRGQRAKINILYDDLINYKEIEKFINEYFEQFNLEKKEKIK